MSSWTSFWIVFQGLTSTAFIGANLEFSLSDKDFFHFFRLFPQCNPGTFYEFTYGSRRGIVELQFPETKKKTKKATSKPMICEAKAPVELKSNEELEKSQTDQRVIDFTKKLRRIGKCDFFEVFQQMLLIS